MSEPELRPCEHIVYLHYLLGGPRDGGYWPNSKMWDAVTVDGVVYTRTSEPVRAEPPESLHVLNCTDDYREHVFYRVNMKLEKRT